MKYEATFVALAGLAAAREISLYNAVVKREVPQEHSHQAIVATTQTNLQLDNPLKIQDAVFALLGNAAAAKGAPNVQNLDCLQQIVADQAFTNAKAAGDVDGQANAIMFRALERNTAAVGQASVLCNQTAVNPEIAAITQHQDPASSAAKGNKQIALDVATQLASIGADPNLAVNTGTFAPGSTSDNTGAGNTCDDANDTVGCIISQNLLVADVTAAEIKSAVAKAARKPRAAAGTNVQKFTGTLGGAAPAVVQSDGARPFSVNGDTFVNAGAALQRSCAVQHNACSNAANAGSADFSVSDCGAQEDACNAANAAKKFRKLRRAALDFGSCSNPAIAFGPQNDRGGADAFAAVDQTDFNHGSANAINVISSFICQQLGSKCKAAADAVTACDSAATAAKAQTGQAAADAFNSALGVTA